MDHILIYQVYDNYSFDRYYMAIGGIKGKTASFTPRNIKTRKVCLVLFPNVRTQNTKENR